MEISRLLLWLIIQPIFSLHIAPEHFPPQTHTVIIKAMKFVPAEINVKRGDMVIWINQDMVGHNVTEERSKAWISPVIPAGKSWKMVIKQSSSYFCSFHPVMKGEIQVH
jgi:plastocyanin